MSRYRRGGWTGAGIWPFMMCGPQPGGGWSEQTMGMGFGQRPGRANDICPPSSNNFSGLDQPPSLDLLSSLFTRLILQNHLTRLAGDSLGLGGRGVWGCSVPAPSCSQPSACSSSPSRCQSHPPAHGQQSPGCEGHTNNINVCHTCPAASIPYITSNNVFVIPALQQLAGAGSLGNPASLNLNHNNMNAFLGGLGNGLNGCGVGMGGSNMNNSSNFSCRGCGLQM